MGFFWFLSINASFINKPESRSIGLSGSWTYTIPMLLGGDGTSWHEVAAKTNVLLTDGINQVYCSHSVMVELKDRGKRSISDKLAHLASQGREMFRNILHRIIITKVQRFIKYCPIPYFDMSNKDKNRQKVKWLHAQFK